MLNIILFRLLLHTNIISFFFLIYLFNVFIFGCSRSLQLRAGPLRLRRVRDTLHRGVRASHCGGLPHCGAWALGARAPAVVAHRPSCSAACGIFLDQGPNPCPLHWQADSQPLCHQGSPDIISLN